MSQSIKFFLKFISFLTVYLTVTFFINNILIVYFNWPGADKFYRAFDSTKSFESFLSILQFLSYLLTFIICIYLSIKISDKNILFVSNQFSEYADYIARSSFWAILFIGIFDVLISFMAAEKILSKFMSDSSLNIFTKPSSRALLFHLPLALIGFIIGYYKKAPSFIWFATLVVFAEASIVITRYVFFYEQAFMGDLVRLWYSAIFLISSAYTLVQEGHVRIDILYVKFKEKTKAISNIAGSILLGIPLCAITIFIGLQGKTSIINAPVLSVEVTQQGVSGMYVKYLLAVFLAIFAITMIFQFASVVLSNTYKILKDKY